MTPEYISEQRVRAALNPVHPLVDALEEAFRNFLRVKKEAPFNPCVCGLKMLIAMPGYSANDQALAIKVLTRYNDKKRTNLQTFDFHGVLLLFHADIGCLASVRVYSRTRSSSEKLVSHIGSRGKVCESAEDAVKNADIIITATFSKQPLVFKDWLKPGAHINGLAIEGAVTAKLVHDSECNEEAADTDRKSNQQTG
ncbi:ketimine reductase mu-crystallin-like [Tubulanus polymorphus]|uniref:ketimine reductase mu-crystallin-like n=1 Tax=Tubulanus polymorphus TaxID=672921 RepID=UPI003DA200F2